MADIVVELDAYVVPDDHAVWKCFPGKTYRFYEIVQQANVVFLDVRNLEGLTSNLANWDDKKALKIIADDRWQRELERVKGTPMKTKGSSEISRTDKRTLTFVKGLLFAAKRGDLIVLPAEGYRKDVLIGELLDDASVVVKHEANDGNNSYTYIGRRVKWRSSQEKRFFSRDLIDLLHTQSAFFLLPKSLNEEIYRLAYENFIAGNVYAATFHTTKQKFSTSDSAVTGMWFNALAAVREAIERGESLGDKSYLVLGLTPAENANEGELAININSPGQYLLRSVGVFAIVAMAMMPLSEVAAADIINGNVHVELHVIGSASNSCALNIDAAIAEYAKNLAVVRLQEHCEIGKRAKKEATLKTRARLK